MSILLESTPPEPGLWAILYALAAVGLVGAGILGVFRGSSVFGRRMEKLPRLAPLAVPFLIGAVTFFLSQVVYLAYAQSVRGTPGEPFSQSQFVLGDWLFMATAPFAAALAAMALAHAIVRGAGLQKLGLTLGGLPAGLLWGIVGIVVSAPIVFWFSALSEWVYRIIGYVHPMEHDLLRVLPDAGAGQKILLLIGITVCAPVTEEVLFRGHLQSLLRRLLGGRRVEPADVQPLLTAVGPTDAPAMPAPDAAAPPLAPAEDRAMSPWTAWVAILVTSALFAVIHPIWSAPPIFLLSVALGFAYERTGNLWTPMFMHALFNAGSTALFILMQASR